MTTPRRLVLVRHAEAGPAAVDADRQLTPGGERQAADAGRWLADAGVRPDLVVGSPARRTRQTWDLLGPALPGAPRPVLDERLYEGTLESLLEVVRATAADVGTLVVVGHNPPVGQAAHVLPAERARLDGFPPGSVAVLASGGPFAALRPGTATLADLRLPGGR